MGSVVRRHQPVLAGRCPDPKSARTIRRCLGPAAPRSSRRRAGAGGAWPPGRPASSFAASPASGCVSGDLWSFRAARRGQTPPRPSLSLRSTKPETLPLSRTQRPHREDTERGATLQDLLLYAGSVQSLGRVLERQLRVRISNPSPIRKPRSRGGTGSLCMCWLAISLGLSENGDDPPPLGRGWRRASRRRSSV